MDISIALLDDAKDFTVPHGQDFFSIAELGAFQAVYATRTFALPPQPHGAGVLIGRGAGSGLGATVRYPIVSGHCRFAEPPDPQALIEYESAHRDTTNGSHASGS